MRNNIESEYVEYVKYKWPYPNSEIQDISEFFSCLEPLFKELHSNVLNKNNIDTYE